MIGTVKNVARVEPGGPRSATITTASGDEILTDIELWVFEDLRAALIGGKPVTVALDESGNVSSVKVG